MIADPAPDADADADAATVVEPRPGAGDSGLVTGADGCVRCFWPGRDPGYQAYHDHEWGRPVADDRRLLEKICLEGFQSGLSWLTILRKRENFRRAFHGFDAAAMAAMGPEDVERLMADPGIVRQRRKIQAAITNGRAALRLAQRHGSLAAFVWRFEPPPQERPAAFDRASLYAITRTRASEAMARALKAEGFVFVGPTTMYAMMQAVGLVNDHIAGCCVQAAVEAERAAFVRP